MPSSPKTFNYRSSPSSAARRSTLLVVSSLCIGISGFLFGLSAFLSTSSSHHCHAHPRSVRVLWETNTNHNSAVQDGDSNEPKRHKVMGFVGIQTGFGSAGRRKSLRKTWLPSDPQSLQRLEESTGLAFRFIIGRTGDNAKMLELKKEVAEYDDFLMLDIEEQYSKLPYKTLAFFKAAYALFDADFYVKADDDIYLRPDRLSTLLAKERSHSQTYLGCLKKGPVFTDPKIKWYEPLSYLLGSEYFLHAYGPIYALSADVVASLVALKNNSFRMFSILIAKHPKAGIFIYKREREKWVVDERPKAMILGYRYSMLEYFWTIELNQTIEGDRAEESSEKTFALDLGCWIARLGKLSALNPLALKARCDGPAL